ncbi:unnamed protein product [Prorocentrum cordatum]|uniref:Uncharacterized protein n=1 Tax=Prorocentrum cordatum TaxID=2364126 RepID=A0ABN9SJT9_9DINO|nr:unnamed protein product [Polarella glacialis]
MVVQASFDYEVRACVMSNACVNGRAPTQQHCGTAVFSSTHVLRCCATKQSNTWRSAGRGIMARSCVGFGVAVPFPRTCPKTARADMAALEAANSLKYRAQRSESHLKIMWCIRAHRPTLSNLPIFLGRVSATTTSARVKPGSSPSAPQTNSTRGRIDSGSSDPHLASDLHSRLQWWWPHASPAICLPGLITSRSSVAAPCPPHLPLQRAQAAPRSMSEHAALAVGHVLHDVADEEGPGLARPALLLDVAAVLPALLYSIPRYSSADGKRSQAPRAPNAPPGVGACGLGRRVSSADGKRSQAPTAPNAPPGVCASGLDRRVLPLLLHHLLVELFREPAWGGGGAAEARSCLPSSPPTFSSDSSTTSATMPFPSTSASTVAPSSPSACPASAGHQRAPDTKGRTGTSSALRTAGRRRLLGGCSRACAPRPSRLAPRQQPRAQHVLGAGPKAPRGEPRPALSAASPRAAAC